MLFDIGIALENPQPVYTCGDRIKGKVFLRSDRPVLVNTLLIQLLCKVTTRTHGVDQSSVSRFNDHESVSVPYCFVKRLVRQPKTLEPGDSLNFAFTLPSETKRNEIEPAWEESEMFEHLADHPIPPAWNSDKQQRGRVVHLLEVLMQAGERSEGKRFGKVYRINFSPCRAVENPDARCVKMLKTINVKLPPAAPRRKSLINLLTHEEKHVVPFQVEVLHPTVLYAGGPIPVAVSAYPLHMAHQGATGSNSNQLTPPDSPMAGPIDAPMAFVEGIYAHLVAQTDRRVREDRRPTSTTPVPQREHVLNMSDMTPICNIQDRPVAISQTRDRLTPLHTQFPELRLSSSTTPSFRAFSLRRKYDLKMKIRVIVSGDQEHVIDLACPVLILPSVHRNTAGALRDNGELMPGLRRRISEETLPPYEVVDPMVAARLAEGLEEPPPLVW